tara:strand:- start:483 stop:908 length:426 start_codon:yes stop_codon:yes gene_type:complete
MTNRTLAIIKPDAVKNNYTGKIYDKILSSNFKIIAAKLIKLSLLQAQGFYEIHRDKPFFDELTQFMSSGKCMVLVLEKNNAVTDWRNTIGATNPKEANESSIRYNFAKSVGENAVHGSDSDENAKKEIYYFFSESELINNQ